jgi:hypothetical protein
MDKLGKYLCLCLVGILAISTLMIIEPTNAQESRNPVQSFWILTDAYAEGATAGIPFKIVIFSYDKYGVQTSNFDGNATLSLQEGTIIPSTIIFKNGSCGPMVTIAGTNLAIITVDDGKGHTGTSIPISITTPSSTPNPSPSVPEFPITALLIAVLVAVSLLLVIGKRKQHNQTDYLL